MLPFADMIKLSDEETALLTPYENPDEAANYLSVSYTHLDVYKRQILLRRGYPEPFCDEITKNLNTDWTAQRLSLIHI